MSTGFDIEGRQVGPGAPVFIIAELSANHGGKLETALATIRAAKEAGADAIKIQTYTPDTLTLKSDAPPFVVRTKNAWAGRTLHDLYTEAMTPWEWHEALRDAARAEGLVFFSTPFDATAVELLERLEAPVYKIASFELTDLPLIEHAARRGKPMILSTGMASLGEIEAAVATCRAAGNSRMALLRCVSCYPARADAMNLQSFTALAQFGTVIGLSDHTRDSTVAVASVALGAKVIEKHFMIDRSVGGPDSFFSLEPSEFRAMVDAVRTAEDALGAPRFGPAPDEVANTTFRRSLFVARDVAAGEVLTASNVRSIRPSHGLAPAHLPGVLGRRATSAVPAGTPLSWDVVGDVPEVAELSLRPATSADSDFLLALRNDPSTRGASRRTEEISPDVHRTWLAATLDDMTRTLLVVMRGADRVGQVRLDLRSHGEAEVSISVTPSARGAGIGAGALHALEAVARQRAVSFLTATLRTDNDASRRLFERAGYYNFRGIRLDGVDLVACERRIVPFGGNTVR